MKTKKTNRRSPKRRSQKPKKQYRIRNWPEYNAALVQRGSLTVWLDAEAVGGWHNLDKSGRRGASDTYTDSALVCALTLQVVYHLPLRATEGLLLSLFGLLACWGWSWQCRTSARSRGGAKGCRCPCAPVASGAAKTPTKPSI